MTISLFVYSATDEFYAGKTHVWRLNFKSCKPMGRYYCWWVDASKTKISTSWSKNDQWILPFYKGLGFFVLLIILQHIYISLAFQRLGLSICWLPLVLKKVFISFTSTEITTSWRRIPKVYNVYLSKFPVYEFRNYYDTKIGSSSDKADLW